MKEYIFKNKKITYIDEGKGEVIVLLPGNTASSVVHESEIEYFSKEYRVICPDYIGYGNSYRVDKFTIDFFVNNSRMIGELISSLGIENFHLVGTSGGGVMALNMAIMFNNRVKSVIADSTPGEFIAIEYANKIKEERNKKTEEQIGFWKYAHGDDWENIVDLDTQMIFEQAESGKSIYQNKLSEINCPVLLTASLADDEIKNIDIVHKDLCEQIKNVKTFYEKEGFHPLMWSKPKVFREQAIKFLIAL